MANPDHVEAFFNGQAAIDRLVGYGGRGNLDLRGADLRVHGIPGVTLVGADIRDADLRGTTLRGSLARTSRDWSVPKYGHSVHCSWQPIRFAYSTLDGAKFQDAELVGVEFRGTSLVGTDFAGATIARVSFSETDLSQCVGLDTVTHEGPSSLDQETLVAFGHQLHTGRIKAFLRGCGYQPWQIEQFGLLDPALTPGEVVEIQQQVFNLRTEGPMFLGRSFISYSHTDFDFANRLYKRLHDKEGASVWLDRHDLVAGDLQKQIGHAIRINDVVILVLSKESVNSKWVRHELEMTQAKEEEEGRHVLLPVALDESWKIKAGVAKNVRWEDVEIHWRPVKDKNVLDFSQWQDEGRFDEQFQKLLKGMKVNYPPKS